MLESTICGHDQHQLLNILCKLCCHQQTIPKSMHIASCLDGELTEVYNGNYTTVFKGEYKGRAVAIKSLQLYLTCDFGKYFKASTQT